MGIPCLAPYLAVNIALGMWTKFQSKHLVLLVFSGPFDVQNSWSQKIDGMIRLNWNVLFLWWYYFPVKYLGLAMSKHVLWFHLLLFNSEKSARNWREGKDLKWISFYLADVIVQVVEYSGVEIFVNK